jgi:hypothetical protein
MGSNVGELTKRRELYPRMARLPQLIEHRAGLEKKTSHPEPESDVREGSSTKVLWWKMPAVVWREVGDKLNSGAVREHSRAERL